MHPDTDFVWPSHLDDKLLFLTNLADFPTVRRRNGKIQSIEARNGKAAATDYAVVLETLNDFYNIGDTKGSSAATTSPAEFQGDSCWNKVDLKEMATANGVKVWNITHVTGPCTGNNPDAEASLDEQYIGAVGIDNEQWYWTDSASTQTHRTHPPTHPPLTLYNPSSLNINKSGLDVRLDPDAHEDSRLWPPAGLLDQLGLVRGRPVPDR